MTDDMEMEPADAEWAEALALRILLARVRPERCAEATERVRAVIKSFEAPRASGARRPARVSGILQRR